MEDMNKEPVVSERLLGPFSKVNGASYGHRGGIRSGEVRRAKRVAERRTESDLRKAFLTTRTWDVATKYLIEVASGSVKPDSMRVQVCLEILRQGIGKATERTEDVSEHADTLRSMAEAATLQAQAKLAEVELEQAKLRRLGSVDGTIEQEP